MHGHAHWLDGLIHENVINSEQRKSCREGANRFLRRDELAHIAQMAVQGAIWSRTAHAVEVAEQNKRPVIGNCCSPFSIGKQLCLNEAFAPAQAKMRVDDVDLPEVCFNTCFNCHAIFTAEKRRCAW